MQDAILITVGNQRHPARGTTRPGQDNPRMEVVYQTVSRPPTDAFTQSPELRPDPRRHARPPAKQVAAPDARTTPRGSPHSPEHQESQTRLIRTNVRYHLSKRTTARSTAQPQVGPRSDVGALVPPFWCDRAWNSADLVEVGCDQGVARGRCQGGFSQGTSCLPQHLRAHGGRLSRFPWNFGGGRRGRQAAITGSS